MVSNPFNHCVHTGYGTPELPRVSSRHLQLVPTRYAELLGWTERHAGVMAALILSKDGEPPRIMVVWRYIVVMLSSNISDESSGHGGIDRSAAVPPV